MNGMVWKKYGIHRHGIGRLSVWNSLLSREEYRELPWASRFFNVCPGSCDPNCQFSHAFVVVHEDCYNIFHWKKKEPHARHPRTRIYINNHSTTKTNLELFFQLMKSTIFCTFTSCSSFQLALCLDLYGSNQSRCAIFWGRKKTHRGHAGCCPLHREEVSPAEGRAVERKNNLLIMTSN